MYAYTHNSQAMEGKSGKFGFIKIKYFHHSKLDENEKLSHRLQDNICKTYII